MHAGRMHLSGEGGGLARLLLKRCRYGNQGFFSAPRSHVSGRKHSEENVAFLLACVYFSSLSEIP